MPPSAYPVIARRPSTIVEGCSRRPTAMHLLEAKKSMDVDVSTIRLSHQALALIPSKYF